MSSPLEPVNAPESSRRLNAGALIRWAGTALALGLLIYLLSVQGWGEFLEAIRQIPWVIFALVVVMMLLTRLLTCVRWYVLLRSARAQVKFFQVVQLSFAGLFSANFLPTTVGGDVVRLAGGMRVGLDGGVCAASLVADRLVGMAGMACFLPAGLPLVFSPTPGSGFTPAVLAAIPFSYRFRSLVDKARRAIASVVQAFSLWIHQPLALGHALAWTLSYQVVLFFTEWLLLHAMGETVSFWTVGGLWCLGYFITLLPISINGLGVQEVAVTYLFTTFGGVSMAAAMALATLMRLLYMLASLPGAAFLPGLVSKRRVNS